MIAGRPSWLGFLPPSWRHANARPEERSPLVLIGDAPLEGASASLLWPWVEEEPSSYWSSLLNDGHSLDEEPTCSLLDSDAEQDGGGAESSRGGMQGGGGGVIFCRVFWAQTVLLLASAAAWLATTHSAAVAECLYGLQGQEGSLLVEYQRLSSEHERLKKELAAATPGARRGPFFGITNSGARQQPEMYGKVPEKTIWTYWHDEDHCPTSKSCVLPPQVQLCMETVQQNKGEFQHVVVHADEVERYLNLAELPVMWRHMEEAPQREAVVAALLARYGGVALHAATLLLRPLDDHWHEMVNSGATMRGYAFRVNGRPWSRPEVLATWFLMSRREGLFRSAARNLIVWMGDGNGTASLGGGRSQLVDQTLLPVLEAFNHSLPNCSADPTVRELLDYFSQAPKGHAVARCPETAQTRLVQEARGPPRNDMRVLLRDPRDGPLLPFALHEDMPSWDVEDSRALAGRPGPGEAVAAGAAVQACGTPKECWHAFFRARLEATPRGEEASLLPCIPLVGHERAFQGMTRRDILSKSGSFFYHWLKIAGLRGL